MAVSGTPWRLDFEERYFVVDRRDGERYGATLPPEPAWYARKTSRGIEMQDVGVLQGTYLGIYIGPVCRYWRSEDEKQCRFCTTGLNVNPSLQKSVEDVVETARAAKPYYE